MTQPHWKVADTEKRDKREGARMVQRAQKETNIVLPMGSVKDVGYSRVRIHR